MIFSELDEIRIILEENEAILYADQFDRALIGYTCQGNTVAVYDYGKMVEVLMLDEQMEYIESCEFIDVNYVCAYISDKQPLIISTGYEPIVCPKGVLLVR